MNRFLALPLIAALAACASPKDPSLVSVSDRFQPALAQRVTLVALADFPSAAGSGAIVSDALERSLASEGYSVVRRREAEKILEARELSAAGSTDPARLQELGRLLGVDALAFGTVTDFTGVVDTTVLVEMPVAQHDPVYARGSSRVAWTGSVPRPAPTTRSSVGLTVRLVDVETGAVLWSAASSGSGLDLTSAVEDAAATAMREVAEAARRKSL
jgi:hypothetical protein